MGKSRKVQLYVSISKFKVKVAAELLLPPKWQWLYYALSFLKLYHVVPQCTTMYHVVKSIKRKCLTFGEKRCLFLPKDIQAHDFTVTSHRKIKYNGGEKLHGLW